MMMLFDVRFVLVLVLVARPRLSIFLIRRPSSVVVVRLHRYGTFFGVVLVIVFTFVFT